MLKIRRNQTDSLTNISSIISRLAKIMLKMTFSLLQDYTKSRPITFSRMANIGSNSPHIQEKCVILLVALLLLKMWLIVSNKSISPMWA